MAEFILMHLNQRSVAVLDEAVQAWSQEPRNAVPAREVQDALRVCLRWPGEFQALWESMWRASPRSFEEHQEAGESLLRLVDRSLGVVEGLQSLVREYEAEGRAIAGSDQLGGLIAELHRLRDYYQEHWAWINEAIIEEAMAEYARGEYQTVQEILNELQGRRQQLHPAQDCGVESS